MTYDLPARSIRLPGAVQYDCPLSTCVYNFCLSLSDEQLGITLTMRLWGENSQEMQVGADQMQSHIKTHAPWEFIDSMAKEEQDFETAIGEMNEKITNADRDKARAWENAQGVQESLQKARQELADTKVALGDTVAVLGRVKGLLAEVAGMPANSYEAATNFALVQQLVQPFGPMAPTLPEDGCTPGSTGELLTGEELEEHRRMHDEEPYLSTACFHGLDKRCRLTCKFCGMPCVHACHQERPAAPCNSTTFCAGWGFCHKCAPELTARAKELYEGCGEVSTEAYRRAVDQAARELGIEVPKRLSGDADAPS